MDRGHTSQLNRKRRDVGLFVGALLANLSEDVVSPELAQSDHVVWVDGNIFSIFDAGLDVAYSFAVVQDPAAKDTMQARDGRLSEPPTPRSHTGCTVALSRAGNVVSAGSSRGGNLIRPRPAFNLPCTRTLCETVDA